MSWTYKTNGTTLVIKNLPDSLIEEDLRDLFRAYGKITHTSLGIDRATGDFTGEALVQFSEQDTAEKACHEMNNCIYQGHTLNMKLTHFRWPKAEATLKVSNLPGFAVVSDLEAIFKSYGPIIRSHLPMDRFTWNARGYGFVEFRNEEIAQRARAEMDGTPYGDVHLKVELTKRQIDA